MGHRPTQIIEADLLAGDALDDVRPGDKHVGGLLHHEDEVGHGRGVDCPPGGGTHDRRDLGDYPAPDGVPIKDLAIAAQRVDALLNAGPPRVVQSHQGRPGLQGQIHHLANLLGVHLPQGTGPGGEVLGIGKDYPALHLAETGDHPVRRDFHLLHPEVDAAMGDEQVGFLEAPGVEKKLQALPGAELARGVLLGHRRGAAHGLHFGFPLRQLPDLF